MLFLWLILLELIIFAALALFLKTFMTRNITKATTHLHQLNEDYSEKLEEAKKQQVEAEKYYDETLLKAKTEAEKARIQILKEAHEAQETTVNNARQQSTDIIQQAEKARESILKELQDRIDRAALENACALLQEVLPDEITEAMHSAWVDRLLDGGLDQLERLNIPDSLKAAEVISAYELKPVQKKALVVKLSEKLKRSISIVDKADPALIAGFKILLGGVVVDGSLQLKIKEASRHAQALS